jgi:transposase
MCPTHGRVQEEIPWGEAFARVSHRFEYAVLRFGQQMTQKAAAELLKIPKSTISDLIHSIVTRERADHKVRDLTLMGVDEISYCKGHKYATIIYDLKRAKVVWVGAGKGSGTLESFLKTKLSEYQRTKIQYACCDMSRAYISTIEKWLKKTTLVVDRFHIVKALNEAMDEVRKEEWRRVSKSKRLALKGIRWILFRHSSTRTKGQTRVINKLRHANNRIYRAWLLKDEFEHFWEYAYTGSAESFLRRWSTRALKSRLKPLRDFVDTLRKHQKYILPFIETGLTNAKGEGINRILKIVKNRASGFKSLAAFADIIYLTIGDLDIPGQIPVRFRTI